MYAKLLIVVISLYSGLSFARTNACNNILNKQNFLLYTEENRHVLNEQFANTVFTDNQGRKFSVEKLELNISDELIIDFFIRYKGKPTKRKPEVIRTNTVHPPYGEAFISTILGTTHFDFSYSNWRIDKAFINRGLIKEPMRWWLSRLEVNSVLNINDASSSKYLTPYNLLKSSDKIMHRVESNATFAKLWELYEMAYREQNPRKSKVPTVEGFLGYIYDMFSVWGRIFRPTGFRSNYAPIKITDYPGLELRKYQFSEKMFTSEREFIKTHEKELYIALKKFKH